MRKLLILLLVTLVSACGFQMRGDWQLPVVMNQTVLVGGSRALFNDLERGFRSASANIVRSQGAVNGTHLRVTQEHMGKRVLSVDNTGKAIEYELYYVLSFDVIDAQGDVLVPQQRMNLTRDYLFAATDVHGTSRQETLLRDEMRREMVQRIMRRLQSLAK